MKPEKLITVAGTIIKENENARLHTSTCQCKKLVVRSNKRTSLNHYTGNPKYDAKCCKSPLRYTGEQLFNGNEIIEPTEMKTKAQIIREFAETNNLPATDVKVVKEKKVKLGMANAEMIAALKENCNNPETLATLFTENEEFFIKNVQCVKDTIKELLLPTIQAKYPTATIQPKNPKVKHIVL